MEIYLESYQDELNLASKRFQLPLSTLPERPIATLEKVLDEHWLPSRED